MRGVPESCVRFSAKAEYACVAMVELAARYAARQPVQIKTIAEAHGISQRFLVQILLQLKGAGLVVSSRGAAGGFVLARAPDTITLADVIYCIEPLPESSALAGSPRSPLIDGLQELWREVSDGERRILQRTTLAHLAERMRGGDASIYQI